MQNKRSVWTVATQPFPEAHFATFPEKLIWPCVLAGSPQGGNVYDPFGGSGTTGAVAKKLGRKYILSKWECHTSGLRMNESSEKLPR
ncbi:site-specific DNA-methyltransferase [Brevibacillus brevis X23]|nr:site-specific DNA-methyltransferase [Brevibacillus brevis X23]